MAGKRQEASTSIWRGPMLFAVVAVLFVLEGTVSNSLFSGSWNTALGILNMGLISAVMALGVNMQWGYAGLFNTGVVGFVALGGLAPALISMPPVAGAWSAGMPRLFAALIVGVLTLAAAVWLWRRMAGRSLRLLAVAGLLIAGVVIYRMLLDPAVAAIEANNPSAAGHIGGLGLPVLLSWPVGALLAAGAGWVVAKTALGLRSDYLAIATLGIGEIIVAILKNEDWLARGVKNVVGIPRPVPYEIDLQADPAFVERAAGLGLDATTASTIWVKLLYAGLFGAVLVALIVALELALRSPWGRMMRAIRDNEIAAGAMGKNVTGRHLQIFVLGAAVIGLAGAMMITLDGQMTPTTYNPLRYTFLIWVMVIVGGSGNNWGSVLGGLLIWYLWIKVEPWGGALMQLITSGMADGWFKSHLLNSAAHMRLLTMGLILLVVLRFAPRGLLPER